MIGQPQNSSPRRAPRRQTRRSRLLVEQLETRTMLSASSFLAQAAHPTLTFTANTLKPQVLSPDTVVSVPAPFLPGDIQAAYGFDQIQLFNPRTRHTLPGDGSGQTIAIVDAFNDPNIAADLSLFDTVLGLPAANLIQVDQNGNPLTAANTPANGPFGWGIETSLDVEWAHALAPKANIVLFEANSNFLSDLFTADASAGLRSTYKALGVPVAGVISNSYGSPEGQGENAFDSVFTTKDNHATYVFSSGDSGNQQYPSASPNVLSVGGTTLSINFDTTTGVESYGGETGWSVGSDSFDPSGGSGGGVSPFEPEPFYQFGVQQTFSRTTPDVSLDADPNTGVLVADSYVADSGLPPLPPGQAYGFEVGGTSFSAPAWGALLTIANQGRALYGLPTLGNAQEAMYFLPTSDFHDITTGSTLVGNAGPGYDLVTGIGSPLAQKVVHDLTFAFTIPPFTVSSTGQIGGIFGVGGTHDVVNLPGASRSAAAEAGAAASASTGAMATNFAAVSIALGTPGGPAATATVGLPAAGQAVQAVAHPAAQVTALPVRAAAVVEGVHGQSEAAPVADTVDTATGEYGLPAEGLAPGAAPILPDGSDAVAPLPATSAGRVSDAVFADYVPLTNVDGAVPAAAGVVAGEDARPVDVAMMAGVALVLGGSWSVFSRQEETRKHPALRA